MSGSIVDVKFNARAFSIEHVEALKHKPRTGDEKPVTHLFVTVDFNSLLLYGPRVMEVAMVGFPNHVLIAGAMIKLLPTLEQVEDSLSTFIVDTVKNHAICREAKLVLVMKQDERFASADVIAEKVSKHIPVLTVMGDAFARNGVSYPHIRDIQAGLLSMLLVSNKLSIYKDFDTGKSNALANLLDVFFKDMSEYTTETTVSFGARQSKRYMAASTEVTRGIFFPYMEALHAIHDFVNKFVEI